MRRPGPVLQRAPRLLLLGLLAATCAQAQTGARPAASAAVPPANVMPSLPAASQPAGAVRPDVVAPRPPAPDRPPPPRSTPPSAPAAGPPVAPPPLLPSPLNVFTPGPASAPAPSAPAPALPGPAPIAATAPDSLHEPGQLLVMWPDAQEAARGQAVLQQRYQVQLRQRHVLEQLGVVVGLLVLGSDAEARALRERLRTEQPDWVVDLNARARPLQSALPRLYAHEMLGAAPPPAAVAGPALRIGVVDTGLALALTQPAALNGSVVRLRSLLEPGELPADTAHGNALLQLIAGARHGSHFAGLGPAVELYWVGAMRDLNGKPASHTLLLARALDWLAGQRVALVNLSLGGPGDAILQAVTNRVLALNIALVAPVGNDPSDGAPPTYPAAYPGVWAATAVDAAGQLYSEASRTTPAMLAAPGVQVWVPLLGEGAYVSGTSYAAALASAALAWQPPAFWKLPPAQRAARICAQARKLQERAGCGLVQRSAGSTPD